MPGRPSRPPQDSPLRRARKARNWTLERTVEEIDLRTPGGHSVVTPSMLSGWELGRHVTSIGHRAMLCEIFGHPPDVLFAHQDERLASGPAAPQLVVGWESLQSAMLATVAGARECLVVTGSRSRDRRYLEAIEAALAERPELVCYRVLFGPPHNQVLKDHLLELLRLRDPGDRSLGVKTLHVGMVDLIQAYSNRRDLVDSLVSAVQQLRRSQAEAGEPSFSVRSAKSPSQWRVEDRLSEADTERLVEAFTAGTSKRKLAERYGISKSSVKRLIRKRGGVEVVDRVTGFRCPRSG
jgi:transcriptional regulator with XRE-family HTH domain